MKRSTSIRLIALLWLMLGSCDHLQLAYHASKAVPEWGWGKRDTLVIYLPVTNRAPFDGELELYVRYGANYPYANLPLTIIHNIPDTTQWHTVHVDLDMTKRNSGISGLYDAKIKMGDAHIAHSGRYTLKAVQELKDKYVVYHIQDISVFLSPQTK
jgi:gliding motility-associated lipoprotein GldH